MKKKPNLPPKRNAQNSENNKNKEQLLITSSKSEINFKDRKTKLKPLNKPKSQKDDLIIKYQDDTKIKLSNEINLKTDTKLKNKEINKELNEQQFDKKFLRNIYQHH